jgi:predicted membrane protein
LTYIKQEPPRLGHRDSAASRVQSWVVKTVAVVGAAVVLMSAIAISFVLFAIAIACLLVFGGYLWWKTRHVRKQMREHFEREGGGVIEGVVIREPNDRQVDRTQLDSRSDTERPYQ